MNRILLTIASAVARGVATGGARQLRGEHDVDIDCQRILDFSAI